MNRETSLCLDAWRLLAALTVFAGHLSGSRLTGGLLWQFGSHMGEAVAVFFVLSGFVIGYAAAHRDRTARAYAVSRLARIYSVALPALAVTFALDSLGRLCRPELYSSAWGYLPDHRAWQFVSGLLFVNQLWGLDVPQGSDLPYWSLGYEVWYYVLFGLATFASPRWRIAGILLALAVMGPAIVSMLPLWLLGLAGYRICASLSVSRRAGWALCLGSLLAWIVFETWIRRWAAAFAPPRSLRQPGLLDAYVAGALFITHIVGFHGVSAAFKRVAARVQAPLRWAAGATFTIYLLHLPVAQFLATQVPWPPASWKTRTALLGGTLLILFLLAEVTERRKEPWRRVFRSVLAQG